MNDRDEQELAWWRTSFALRFRSLPKVGTAMLGWHLKIVHEDGSEMQFHPTMRKLDRTSKEHD